MTYLSRAFLAPRAAGAAVPQVMWWDPNSEGLCVWGAWQAKGVASYAASLLDLSGNGNNLVEGNGAVTWNAAIGWSFVAANSKYFNTQFVPQNDQSQTFLVQFAGITNTAADPHVWGVRNGANRIFDIELEGSTNINRYWNGGNASAVPVQAGGNAGVAGNQGYRDGAADGGAIGAWGGASARSVFLACWNNNGPAQAFITGDIIAAVAYHCTLTALQVSAVTTAMAAL